MLIDKYDKVDDIIVDIITVCKGKNPRYKNSNIKINFVPLSIKSNIKVASIIFLIICFNTAHSIFPVEIFVYNLW